MATVTGLETSRDRRALVADAGYQQLSLFSALAGTLTAFGTLAATAGAAAAVAKIDGRDLELPSQWRAVDTNEGLIVAAALFAAFLGGGYVAGRMARRAGMLHGVAVAVLGMGAAAAAYFIGDITAPAAAVIAAAAAVLVGAVLGGMLGERWHANLVRRAIDPTIGAEAHARDQADKRAAEAEELRTSSFRRARRATPTRSDRVDNEAETVEHRVVRDGDGIVDRRSDRTVERYDNDGYVADDYVDSVEGRAPRR